MKTYSKSVMNSFAVQTQGMIAASLDPLPPEEAKKFICEKNADFSASYCNNYNPHYSSCNQIHSAIDQGITIFFTTIKNESGCFKVEKHADGLYYFSKVQ